MRIFAHFLAGILVVALIGAIWVGVDWKNRIDQSDDESRVAMRHRVDLWAAEVLEEIRSKTMSAETMRSFRYEGIGPAYSIESNPASTTAKLRIWRTRDGIFGTENTEECYEVVFSSPSDGSGKNPTVRSMDCPKLDGS